MVWPGFSRQDTPRTGGGRTATGDWRGREPKAGGAPRGQGIAGHFLSSNRVDYAVGVISLAAVMRGHSIPETALIVSAPGNLGKRTGAVAGSSLTGTRSGL
jgi:hypothetical protein